MRRRLTRIHVDSHAIRHNTKHGTELPPISIVRSKEPRRKASNVELIYDGEVVGRFRYSPHKKILSCGARLVFETDRLEVRVVPCP